jgi:retron-type reverse transcriptase
VEQRAGTKGNADQQSTRRAQDRESVSQALGRIRQAAKQRKKEKFTTLFHHISVELLRLSFFEIKKDAAPGVDGLMWQDYEAGLDRNIEDLHDRVQRGAYRALPSRRQYIPKPDGRQRPIAIATVTSNSTSAPSDFGFDGDNPSLSSASWPTIYRPEGQEGFWR